MIVAHLSQIDTQLTQLLQMWNPFDVSLWNFKYFWLLKVYIIWFYDRFLLLYLNVFYLIVLLYWLRAWLHCFHDSLGSADWSTDRTLFVWARSRLFTFRFLTFQLRLIATSVVCMLTNLTNTMIFYFLYFRNVFESIAILLITCGRWLIGVVWYTMVLWSYSLHFLLLLLKDYVVAIIFIYHDLFWFE